MYEFLVISDIRIAGPDEIYNKIETISKLIIKEVKKLGLSKLDSDFLCDHGPVIQSKIKDSYLRSLHVMAG